MKSIVDGYDVCNHEDRNDLDREKVTALKRASVYSLLSFAVNLSKE